MAEMPRDADSTERHLSVVRRHMRLCRSVKGADFLIAAIEPQYKRQQDTLAVKETANEAEEDGQDDLELRGRESADILRTTAERAKQYDRENPGESTFAKIFPEGGYSDFIASNGTVSSITLSLIATRIKDLGAAHALATLGADYTTRAAVLETAQKTLDDAHRATKLAEAEDELAQAALRRAYEANWLDARKKFGRVQSERLFPRFRRRKGADEGESGSEGGGGGGGPPPT